MIVKKYIANTVEEAQRVIREELGPTAVILTLRYVQQKGWRALFAANKVEVTASVEEEALQEHTVPQLGQEEVVAETTAKTYSDPRFRAKAPEVKERVLPATSAPLSPEDEARAVRKLEALRRQVPSQAEPKVEKSSAPPDILKLSKGLVDHFGKEAPEPVKEAAVTNLEALRQVIREEMQQVMERAPEVPQDDGDVVGGVRFLVAKGLSRSIARDLDAKVQGVEDMTKRFNDLKRGIAELITTAGPIRLFRDRPTIGAIVGPTGVGKTTTLMKIIGQYSLVLHKSVAVISLDTGKVGAREQLQGLVGTVGCPWTVAATAGELRQALAAYGDADLILIDTAGLCQYEGDQIAALQRLLNGIEDLQIYLAISATTKDVDAYGSVQQFAPLGIDSLIFTKLDETIAHGVVVNVCHRTKKPARYLTTGQRIPDDLKVADADDIAKGLLVQNNGARFDRIRQLATV